MNLGQSASYPSGSPPAVMEQNLWDYRNRVFLLARCPTISVNALEGIQSTNRNQWPHPFFFHKWTPDRRGIAPFIPAL